MIIFFFFLGGDIFPPGYYNNPTLVIAYVPQWYTAGLLELLAWVQTPVGLRGD